MAQLAREFDIVSVHPRAAARSLVTSDLVVVRNSGPVAGYPEAYAEFRERALASGARVYNELSGRADMRGKLYLLELFGAGFPVIPTATPGAIDTLPPTPGYVAKPVHGADSIGLAFLSPDDAAAFDAPGMLLQPRIEMRAELSFVFVDHEYQYALTTTPGLERWELCLHEASDDDLAFARRFIEWNDMRHGIQRVDACRTPDGELLLVELEDLNPYLSLDLLDDPARTRFVAAFTAALHRVLAASQSAMGPRSSRSSARRPG